jgi:tetratricopeptide (TPR) repeat protein
VIAAEGATEANVLMQGELAILAGRSDEAVAIFRRALGDLPTAAIYGGLGEAYFTADKVDSAAAVLRQAVELDPENPRHRFNLANALELLDRGEEAGRQFRTYLEQRPDDPVGRFHFAVHLMHRDRREAAAAELARAVQLDPGYVQARVVLAQVYEELGRPDDALAQVEALLELDPGSEPELLAWRDQLQDDRAGSAGELAAGRVHLLHIVVAEPEAAAALERELAAGADFSALAARFSQGASAARGGDIGWVDPTGMVPALREAIAGLQPGRTSPPVTVGGQVHVFKRVR